MQDQIQEVVPERIRATQGEIQGIGESANRSIAGSAQDSSPVQLGYIRVLLNQSDVVKDKVVEESIGVERDYSGGQKEAEKDDPGLRRAPNKRHRIYEVSTKPFDPGKAQASSLSSRLTARVVPPARR